MSTTATKPGWYAAQPQGLAKRVLYIGGSQNCKTTHAVSQAHTLSLSGHKVLVLDADPTDKAAARLGFDTETESAHAHDSVESIVRTYSTVQKLRSGNRTVNFDFIPHVSHFTEKFSPEQINDFIVSKGYDVVIVDVGGHCKVAREYLERDSGITLGVLAARSYPKSATIEDLAREQIEVHKEDKAALKELAIAESGRFFKWAINDFWHYNNGENEVQRQAEIISQEYGVPKEQAFLEMLILTEVDRFVHDQSRLKKGKRAGNGTYSLCAMARDLKKQEEEARVKGTWRKKSLDEQFTQDEQIVYENKTYGEVWSNFFDTMLASVRKSVDHIATSETGITVVNPREQKIDYVTKNPCQAKTPEQHLANALYNIGFSLAIIKKAGLEEKLDEQTIKEHTLRRIFSYCRPPSDGQPRAISREEGSSRIVIAAGKIIEQVRPDCNEGDIINAIKITHGAKLAQQYKAHTAPLDPQAPGVEKAANFVFSAYKRTLPTGESVRDFHPQHATPLMQPAYVTHMLETGPFATVQTEYEGDTRTVRAHLRAMREAMRMQIGIIKTFNRDVHEKKLRRQEEENSKLRTIPEAQRVPTTLERATKLEKALQQYAVRNLDLDVKLLGAFSFEERVEDLEGDNSVEDLWSSEMHIDARTMWLQPHIKVDLLGLRGGITLERTVDLAPKRHEAIEQKQGLLARMYQRWFGRSQEQAGPQAPVARRPTRRITRSS